MPNLIHPKARTTPAVRAEIARSIEPHGFAAPEGWRVTETIRKWRKRGAADCQDHSAARISCPGKQQKKSGRCALRRATGFPLDHLIFVVTHLLPHLNRPI